MADIDWKVLSDHLFQKSEQAAMEAMTKQLNVPDHAAASSAAVILRALAEGIQKATTKFQP